MVKIYSLIHNECEKYEYNSIYSYIECNNISNEIIRIIDDEADDCIVGILSNGYYLVRHEQPLNEYDIECALRRADLILPYENSLGDKNVQEYYVGNDEFIIKLEQLNAFLSEQYPELIKSYEWVLKCHSILPGNMIIAKNSFLKNFYSMCFNFSEIIENDIIIGILLKTWIHYNGYKVYSTHHCNDKVELWNSGYKKIELVKNYIKLLLSDYIQLRAKEGFTSDFAGDNPYSGDFGGKHPIWICWWQGEDKMPPLIKGCISSVKNNAPSSAEVKLLTLDNINEYVTFTDAVIDKFEKGIITYTHLSDILRAELLYRYGGMWIDATYYVSRIIPDSLLDEKFYTIAFEQPLWGMDVMNGRWTLSLLVAQRHNPAMQFLMEGLWLYWEKAQELVDYFTVDYVFDAGYEAFEDIRAQVDSVIKSPTAVYDLQLKMNQKIDAYDIEWLKGASLFYKLNRRNEYVSNVINGDRSFYGYIVGADDKTEIKNLIIHCDGYISLVNNLRSINAKRILDLSGCLYSRGEVSRGIINEVLNDDVIIDTICTDEIRETVCNIEVDKCVTYRIGLYDSIYDRAQILNKESEDCISYLIAGAEEGLNLIIAEDLSQYDAIIVEKNNTEEFCANGDYYRTVEVSKLKQAAIEFKKKVNELLLAGEHKSYERACGLIASKEADPFFQVDKELMNFRVLAVVEKAQLDKGMENTLFDGRDITGLEQLYQEIVFRLRRLEFGIDIDVKRDIITFMVEEKIGIDVLFAVLQGTLYLYSKERIKEELIRGID